MFLQLFEYLQNQVYETSSDVQDDLKKKFGSKKRLPRKPSESSAFFLLSDGTFVDISQISYHAKAAALIGVDLQAILDLGAIRGVLHDRYGNDGCEIDFSSSMGIGLTSEQKHSLQLLLDRPEIVQAFLEQDDKNYFVEADQVDDFAKIVIDILNYRPIRKKFVYPPKED